MVTNLFKFDPSDGSVSGDIHMFSDVVGGEIQPFDRDGVAIRIQGGEEQGVWIYRDKKLERIIPGICESMYVQ